MKKYYLLTALLLLGALYAAAQGEPPKKDATMFWNANLSSPIAVFNKLDTQGGAQAAGATIGVQNETDNVVLKMSGQSGRINMLKLENNATLQNLQGTAPVPQWKTPKIDVSGNAQIKGKNLTADKFTFDSNASNPNQSQLIAVNGTKSGSVTVHSAMTITDANVTDSLEWGFTSFSEGGQNATASWGTIIAGEDGETEYEHVLSFGNKTLPPPVGTWKQVYQATAYADLHARRCWMRVLMSAYPDKGGLYVEARGDNGKKVTCTHKGKCSEKASTIRVQSSECNGQSGYNELSALLHTASLYAAQYTDLGYDGGIDLRGNCYSTLLRSKGIKATPIASAAGSCIKGEYGYILTKTVTEWTGRCKPKKDGIELPTPECHASVSVACTLYQCQ